MQTLLLFPLSRRQALVRRLARQMLDRSPAEAEKHLAREMARHGRVLRRRAITGSEIATQLAALQAAVRTELWRRVLLVPQPTDAA